MCALAGACGNEVWHCGKIVYTLLFSGIWQSMGSDAPDTTGTEQRRIHSTISDGLNVPAQAGRASVSNLAPRWKTCVACSRLGLGGVVTVKLLSSMLGKTRTRA